MIFVLNCLSRYRDLHIHELCKYKPNPTIQNLMAFGCVGPFGHVFVETNASSAETFWDTFPLSYYPQLKTQPNTFPVQSDSYNCGVYVVYTIQDLIVTQWDKHWMIHDVLKPIDKNKLEVWNQLIQMKQTLILPARYQIGTAFVRYPAKTTGKEYKRLCD
jgi:hypothetical protein